MPVDFQISVGGDLSSTLGSEKNMVAITKMSFLPYPPDHPAPLVPPVTPLQVLGSLLGWVISSYPSSSLCHHSLILRGLLPKCLFTLVPQPHFPAHTHLLQWQPGHPEENPALLRACGSTGGRQHPALLGTVL